MLLLFLCYAIFVNAIDIHYLKQLNGYFVEKKKHLRNIKNVVIRTFIHLIVVEKTFPVPKTVELYTWFYQ